ncbi:hypothetical protein IGI04_008640 [Brassica rapa subsp. trilocularis]|uniref:BHLH domain-containing protein n=1 Tax=Brassica rapa subsp. trilocularis TaxID=1813537 RepID=A0ABQ7NN81_BRACM|nr:hypothetical protein IGI04_008640 [Brassica rapa subsp. trilocularis]
MPLDTRQWDLPPQACFEDTAARCIHPGVPLPELGELYAAELQAPFKSLLWSHDKESCGKRFSLSDMRSWCAAAAATTTPHGGALESSSQKRLMILDQSGNQTRLFQCPFPLTAEPVKLSELDEHYGQESEMHEDTEEINALLYSDEEDCESDDEVMSTGHSPYPLEQVCNKRVSEEIDAPSKRQKLLDISQEDTGSGLSNEQSRKDKIRTALKILESIVPGAKGNQALLLLDEAIDYLKLLKQDLNHC